MAACIIFLYTVSPRYTNRSCSHLGCISSKSPSRASQAKTGSSSLVVGLTVESENDRIMKETSNASNEIEGIHFIVFSVILTFSMISEQQNSRRIYGFVLFVELSVGLIDLAMSRIRVQKSKEILILVSIDCEPSIFKNDYPLPRIFFKKLPFNPHL